MHVLHYAFLCEMRMVFFFYSSLYHNQYQQCTILEAKNYHFILLGIAMSLYVIFQEEVGR